MTVTLYGNGGLCRGVYIKHHEIEPSPYLIPMGLRCNHTCSHRRESCGASTDGGEGEVTTEAGIGTLRPQEVLAATRNRGSQGTGSPSSLGGSTALLTPWFQSGMTRFRFLASSEKINSCCFKPLTVWPPSETDTAPFIYNKALLFYLYCCSYHSLSSFIASWTPIDFFPFWRAGTCHSSVNPPPHPASVCCRSTAKTVPVHLKLSLWGAQVLV